MNRALPFTSKQALPSDSIEDRNRLGRHNRHKARMGNIAARSIHSQVRSSTAMQQQLQTPERRLQARVRCRVRPNLRANHRPNELLRAIRSRRKWRRWLLLREQVFACFSSYFNPENQCEIVLPVPQPIELACPPQCVDYKTNKCQLARHQFERTSFLTSPKKNSVFSFSDLTITAKGTR